MCAGMCSKYMFFIKIVGIRFGSRDMFWWYIECIKILVEIDYGIEIFLALGIRLYTV